MTAGERAESGASAGSPVASGGMSELAPDVAGDLAEYEQQKAQVAVMLLEDPENEELQQIYNDLSEVIELTREVQQAQPGEAQAAAAVAHGQQHEQVVGPAAALAVGPAAETGAALLPPQMAKQIKHAQQRAALAGQGPAEWAVGAKCRAVFNDDGNWYNAVVDSVSGDSFVVVFDGYGTKQEVGKEAIQLHAEEEEGGYKGVAAPKRRRVDESAEVQEMPKWLEVKPEDDEKTKQKKRKLAKAYKSKARFAKLDQQQKQKADAWKRFLAGKPKKSKGAS